MKGIGSNPVLFECMDIHARIVMIEQAVKEQGWHYINSRQFPHKDDWFLYRVMTLSANKEHHQVHAFNFQDGGLFWGHYHLTGEEAKEVFAKPSNLNRDRT